MSDRIIYDSAANLQQAALDELYEMGVDFFRYVYLFEYAGTPRRLLNDIQRGSKQTLKNLAKMEEEYDNQGSY